MTLGEKIRAAITNSPFRNVSAFHREMVNVFDQDAVSRRALSEIINGHTQARERTLNQIAIILGVRTTDLRRGTDAEVLEQEEILGAFTYNDRAVMQALANRLPFMPCKLVLRRGGHTTDEQDDPQAPAAVKWCAVIMGGVTLSVQGEWGAEEKTWYKGHTFSFDPRRIHRFINAYAGTTVLYIIHSPARNSDFYLEPPVGPETGSGR